MYTITNLNQVVIVNIEIYIVPDSIRVISIVSALLRRVN